MSSSNLMAVLTGDLIKSGSQPPETLDLAMEQLQSAADAIAEWNGQRDLRFTRFRGDGWQLWLREPWLGLRAALVLIAELRSGGTSLSTRISIGIGPKESIGSTDLSDAHGPAFFLSGRGLDEMGKTRHIALAGPAITERDRIIANLMFERASRWTAPQAQAMALYLHPNHPTLADLGRVLGISPQAVNYRLGGGGATELRATLTLWEEVIQSDLSRVSP